MRTLPKNRPPTHPGKMLLKEFLEPLRMTQMELAERIHLSYPRVNELIHGKRSMTPDTALRLAKLLGTTPEFWLNGQRNWDLWHAMHAPEAREIERIRSVRGAAQSRAFPPSELELSRGRQLGCQTNTILP